MFTIVIVSFHSDTHIKRLISNIDKKYPIIIIENSLNFDLKKSLEDKYDHVKVIVPEKNIGISAGYNLGIKESKTNFVKITSADINITNKCLQDLEHCIKQIKNFALLGPSYDDESVYKNYSIWDSKKLTNSHENNETEKYKIKEVDYLENDFIINKKNLEDLGFFDENIFMYYETMDFCKKIRKENKKNYVCQNIKFTHFGSQSVDQVLLDQYKLNRSWHYNWSKFYYFKKNYNYFKAIRKIYPNIIRAFKQMIICKIFNRKKEYLLHKLVLLGIISSIFNKPSSYRPFEVK
jgi:N-acetylglucosaminyl-diphospho-decaprenol L-rhamnosyltransferase